MPAQIGKQGIQIRKSFPQLRLHKRTKAKKRRSESLDDRRESKSATPYRLSAPPKYEPTFLNSLVRYNADEPGFAYSGLALDKHRLNLTALRSLESPSELLHLLGPSEKWIVCIVSLWVHLNIIC
jgi:hypothetical protein